MILKKGDLLYCHTPCVMQHSGQVTTTVGKTYVITNMLDENLVIYDDTEKEHHFSLINDDCYYKIWFYSPRKAKLEKLEKMKCL